ncbi:MAG: Ig-like domain-containing protein [Candidatus Eisenbacteria bacterium]|nr:Ig-like domain-containing protein [Candidatus Eisenbacteria bacterium]
MRTGKMLRMGFLLLLTGWILLNLTCAPDEPVAPEGWGRLQLIPHFIDSVGAGKSRGFGAPDSIRLIVLNTAGRTMARGVAPIDAEGRFRLEVDLQAGGPYDATVTIESAGSDPQDTEAMRRGGLYLGEAKGFNIQAGETTRDTLAIWSILTSPELLEGAPGDISYTIGWDGIREATLYDIVAEGTPGNFYSWSTPDTTRLFALAEVQKLFALSPDASIDPSEINPLNSETATFWVRARTPRITGHYGGDLSVPVGVWRNLPRVVSVQPGDGASAIPDTSSIYLRFSIPMVPADLEGPAIALKARASGEEIAEVSREIDADGRGLRIVPLTYLPENTWISITAATALRDLDLRPLDQEPETEGLQGFTSEFQVASYIRLRVVTVDPPDGTDDIGRRPVITVTLNRPAQPSTVEAAVLLTDTLGVAAGRSVVYSEEDTTLTITPSQNLAWEMLYTLEITPALVDIRGLSLDQDPATAAPDTFTSTFRILDQPVGPQVAFVLPVNGATNVPVGIEALIAFDRAVDPLTVDAHSLVIRKPPFYADIDGRIFSQGDSITFGFIPTNPLGRGLVYRIAVTTAVKDANGIPLDQDLHQEGLQEFISIFETEENPRVVQYTPNVAQNVGIESVFVLDFSKALDPSTVNGGTVYLERAEDSAVVPASVTLDENATEVRLDPDGPLGFVKQYILRATTAILSADGVALDQNYDTPQHESFSYTFRTVIDSTPTRVAEWTPPNGAVGVPETSRVEVVFERPIKPATIHGGTFQFIRILSPTDSIPVEGVITVSADSLHAVYAPDDSLASGGVYRFRLTRFVANPYGVLLDQNPDLPGEQEFVSRFQARSETIPPRVADWSPGDSAMMIPRGAHPQVTFSEPVRPEMLTTSFRLLHGEAVVAGQYSASADSLTWTFEPADSLAHATLYTIGVDTTVMDRVGNFLDQDPDIEGLQPFHSVFTTVPDTLGPWVTAIDPENGAGGVKVYAKVTLTFSEPLDPQGVTNANVQVGPEGGNPLAGSLELLDNNTRVRWSLPQDQYMDFSTRHRVLAGTGLTDLFDNPLDQIPGTHDLDPYEAFFTTSPETLSPRVLDLILPAVPFPPAGTLAVIFDEPIDPATIAPGGVDILLNDTEVGILLSVAATGDTAFAIPSPDPLLPNETYTFRVTPSVTDTLGNPLDQDPSTVGYQSFIQEFATGDDETPPHVVSVEPPDSTVGVGPMPDISLTFSERLDPSTIDNSTIKLIPEAGSAYYSTQLLGDGRTVKINLIDELRDGLVYRIRARSEIRDLAGNELDQDLEAPGVQIFQSSFTVGTPPLLVLSDNICRIGDSSHVIVDASGSSDADGDLLSIIWDWGDGSVDSLAAPAGLIAEHIYDCTDVAGCDSLDNDGDGLTDETGAGGCDESYHIIATLYDDSGFGVVDSTGVSFCDFRALWAEPADGAVQVDTLAVVRMRFSRPALADSLNKRTVFLQPAGGSPIEAGLLLSQGGSLLTLTPDHPLIPDTEYEIVATTAVTAEDGEPLDQTPCGGATGWTSTFITRGRAASPPGGEDPPSEMSNRR